MEFIVQTVYPSQEYILLHLKIFRFHLSKLEYLPPYAPISFNQ